MSVSKLRVAKYLFAPLKILKVHTKTSQTIVHVSREARREENEKETKGI